MSDTPDRASYPKWRCDLCLHCAAGVGMSGYKNHHFTGNANPPVCTAPSADELIERQAAEIASALALIAVIRGAGNE